MKSRIWTIMNGVTLTAFLVGRSSGQQPPDPPGQGQPPPAQPPDPPAPALVRQPPPAYCLSPFGIY